MCNSHHSVKSFCSKVNLFPSNLFSCVATKITIKNLMHPDRQVSVKSPELVLNLKEIRGH